MTDGDSTLPENVLLRVDFVQHPDGTQRVTFEGNGVSIADVPKALRKAAHDVSLALRQAGR